MIGGVLLTGALHEDGFADVCDGFGGGTSREKVLEIMRDSRIGAFGAIGIVLMLATKYAALISLPFAMVPAVLLAAHPLSRLFSTALIWRLGYARAEGKAASVAQGMTSVEFAFAFISGVLPVAALVYLGFLAWQQALAGFFVAVLAAACLTRLFARRIGGYTGDCLGAMQQLTEAGFYLGLLSCWFCTGRIS